MQIRSKKTGQIHEVSKMEWEEMRSRYEHRRYVVVDDSDDSLISEEINVEPVSLIDDPYDDMAKTEMFYSDDDEKKHIKEKLDEAGVSYHPNTGIEKLRQKLERLNDE